jgi:hypothetical protein
MASKQTKTTKKEEKSTPKKNVKPQKETKKKSLKPKLKKNTQITDPLTYDVKNNMMFEEVVEGDVPGLKIPMKYYRFPVYTKNPDGKTVGDLILEFGELMCFGVSINTDQNTGDPIGHSMALSLLPKENATDEEKMRVKKLEEIIEFAKEYVVEHCKDIKQPKLEMSDLKKFSPIYYKKDPDGNVIPDAPPSLYPKLLESKPKTIKVKNEEGKEEEKEIEGKILTIFYEVDEDWEPKLDEDRKALELDPSKIIDKFCKVKPLIKVESVFSGGSGIKLQVKVSESDVKLLQQTSRRLLHTSGGNKAEKLMKEDKKDEETVEEKVVKKEVEPVEVKKEVEKKKKAKKESPKKVVKDEEEDMLSLDD